MNFWISKRLQKHAGTRERDVYELNVDDIRAVAMSQHIPGKMLLTDSYNVNATSSITVPVSIELTNRLIRQRPRFI
jgi:hypothetical protein